ncbi:MAG: DEAD/DEAH box helicase, partial [Elusimicrobiota bacterium]|nr:DEAD/DEAH box helicase [Elusimicrobiota bacterium]
MIGSAQTGSGKTVAFTLPLLQRLLADREAEGGAKAGLRVRALVLTPTRELATQVERMISELAKFSPVKCVVVIGGASFHAQTQELKRGAEVVVATPGRLLDHIRSGT